MEAFTDLFIVMDKCFLYDSNDLQTINPLEIGRGFFILI